MSPVTDVLDVALQLSKSERARAAQALLESLEGSAEDEQNPAALQEVIEQRLEAFRRGATSAEDWRVVMNRLRASIGRRA